MSSDDSGASIDTALESRIGRHTAGLDFGAAATLLIEAYGTELLSYLHAMAPTPTEAEEMFADLCERLWMGLPTFRSECSFRTWSYCIARNLLHKYHRTQRGPRGRVVELDDASGMRELAQRVVSTTAIYLKTESKTRLEQIREMLDDDDRTLLILRVDRRLSWRDVAQIMAADGEDLTKVITRLRKRFERIKERLRKELTQGTARE